MYLEYFRIFLPVHKRHCYLSGAYRDNSAFIQETVPYVGFPFLIILVKVNHVATAEVRQEAFALTGHGQRDNVGHAAVTATLLSLYSQSYINVAGLYFLGQRHVPQVCHTAAYTLLRTNFGCKLLTVNKRHHAAEVFPFERSEAFQRFGNCRYPRQKPPLVKLRVKSCRVHRIRREQRQHLVKARPGYHVVGGDNLVAQLDCLAEQVTVECNGQESVDRRVFGIKKTYVGPVETEVEVIPKDSVIKQQLHVMRLELAAAVATVAPRLDVPVLARLLLDEQAEVCRHHVNTPLKAEFLTDERRLEHNAPPVVFSEHHVNRLPYIACLRNYVTLEACGIETDTR